MTLHAHEIFGTGDVLARPRIWVIDVLPFRYDTRWYFNVRSKADRSQLNLPQGYRTHDIQLTYLADRLTDYV